MRPKIEKKKITISITLDVDILNMVNDNFGNRSKFIESCLIDELCKSDKFRNELKNNKKIL